MSVSKDNSLDRGDDGNPISLEEFIGAGDSGAAEDE